MTIVVVSPHLDDGVLSVGATIHALRRHDVPVRMVTLFAGDPANHGRPSYWDARRGRATAAEASKMRREEDQAAADRLGVEPAWLPFDDSAYVALRDPAAMWQSLAPLLLTATAVIVPGWPLTHPDHRYTTMLVLERSTATPMLFYSELPYAARPGQLLKSIVRRHTPSPLRYAAGEDFSWSRVRITEEDRRAKTEAVACYAGEVLSLGYRAQMSRLYDLLLRREMIGHSRGTTVPPDLTQLL